MLLKIMEFGGFNIPCCSMRFTCHDHDIYVSWRNIHSRFRSTKSCVERHQPIKCFQWCNVFSMIGFLMLQKELNKATTCMYMYIFSAHFQILEGLQKKIPLKSLWSIHVLYCINDMTCQGFSPALAVSKRSIRRTHSTPLLPSSIPLLVSFPSTRNFVVSIDSIISCSARNCQMYP